MVSSATLPAPDLTQTQPASPFATLGGYILLPRILDKCRAEIAGTIGEYSSGCGLDLQFFNHFQVTFADFKAMVESGADDDAVLEWLSQRIAPAARTEDALAAWAYDVRCYAPDTPEKKAYFEQYRRQYVPNRNDITTWLALLDAEEGRS